MCGLDGEVGSAPGRSARLRGWLVNGQSPPSRLVCSNGHEWPARSTAFLRVADRAWWRWPSKAMRVLMRHRTAEPVPLFWFAAALVGVALGVAADLALGWVWWLVAVGFLILVWLVFLATALRYPGRDALVLDLVATVSPLRAQDLERSRLLEQVENAPGPVYGLMEWEGSRHIGGHGFSPAEGLTHLKLIYGSPLDQPHLTVNTIWPRPNRPHLAIRDVRERLTRKLWRGQLRPPDHLDGDQRVAWMRQQRSAINERPIPDWTSASVRVEGVAHPAELYREGDDWVAIGEMDGALIEIGSHQVPFEHVVLGPLTDLSGYATRPPDRDNVPP